MKLGVCYYPEHWPQERWSIDAELMRKAGLSLVRIADFSWAAIERREGEYTWDWLDKAIEVLAAEGLQIILCTPTASPPPWLCQSHPEILPVDIHGRRRRYGSRRHYCPNSKIYQQYSLSIVSAMGSRYGKYPEVVGWQIDNEFGCHDTARCYCESCTSTFRSWLKSKYENIDALNIAWGTIFWSQVYNNWNEIYPPNLTIAEPNPSHVLDYYRFSSDSYVNYQQLQISTLLTLISKDQIITTNFMDRFYDLDYFNLAKSLDRVTKSSYPTGHAESRASLYLPSSVPPAFAYDVGDPYVTGMGHALMRGFKSQHPFWVMEQQCGNVNWSSYNTGIRPGTVRLWTWHALISGAEAVLYFRWRAGLLAQEQLHSGLLHHNASLAVGYTDLESMQAEHQQMLEIASAPHHAQIALLLDYDSLWAIRLQPHHHDFEYMRLIFVYYRALQRLGISVDFVSADADFNQYKLVIVPSAYIATEQLSHSLIGYVEAGGMVLFGVRSGFKDELNRVTERPLPGLFHDLVGYTVSDWHSLPPGVSYDLDSIIPGMKGPVTIWAEVLKPSLIDPPSASVTTQDLAHYTSGPFNTHAALGMHTVKDGSIFYLGWYPNDSQAESIMEYLATKAGIESLGSLPEGMIASQRGPHLILLNFTDEILAATVQGRKIIVKPRDVEVIRSMNE